MEAGIDPDPAAPRKAHLGAPAHRLRLEFEVLAHHGGVVGEIRGGHAREIRWRLGVETVLSSMIWTCGFVSR